MGNSFRPRVNDNTTAIHSAPSVVAIARRHSLRVNDTRAAVTTTQRQRFRVNYSRNEQELMHHFLQDLMCEKPSTQLDLITVRDHWQRLHMSNLGPSVFSFHEQQPQQLQQPQQAPILRLLENFRYFLLSLEPEATSFFHGLPRVQERTLAAMIGGLVTLLEDENAVETSGRLAMRLFQYGVRCEQFNAFGGALLMTLKSLAPKLFTRHTEQAWRAVICQVGVLVVTQLDWLYRQSQLNINKSKTSRDLNA